MRRYSRPGYVVGILIVVILAMAVVGCGKKARPPRMLGPGAMAGGPPGPGMMPGAPGMSGPPGPGMMPGGPGMSGPPGPGMMPGGPGMGAPPGPGMMPGMGGMGTMGGGAAAPAAPPPPVAAEITAGEITAPKVEAAKAAASIQLTPEQAAVIKDAAALLKAYAEQQEPPELATAAHNTPPLALSLALTKVAQLSRGLDLSSQKFFHEYWALYADEILGDVSKAHPNFPARQLIMAAEQRADWEPFFWRWAVAEMLAARSNACSKGADCAGRNSAPGVSRHFVSCARGYRHRCAHGRSGQAHRRHDYTVLERLL